MPALVQALPGPTPTSRAAAPVRMRCSAVWWLAQPPTMTGVSMPAMNVLRFSGSPLELTCSAETTLPWMTRTSRPASIAVLCSSTARDGVTPPAQTTPAALISATRAATSSGSTGCSYAVRSAGTACAGAVSASRSNTGPGSSYRVHRPSRSRTPRPPQPAERDRGVGRGDRVHGGRQDRQLEAVGVQVPGERHVAAVAGPARRGRSTRPRSRTPGGRSSRSRSRRRPRQLPAV